jgi:peptidoglycan/xylan/chitin deacetylase (PgdA/CDA1 family)
MNSGDIASAPILTYHSISDEPGPTSIPPAVFAAQMEAVAASGVVVVGLDAIERWLGGNERFPRRTIAITFDDAFEDFARAAFPILKKHELRATVFAPTARLGGVEDWSGANASPRRLMDWTTVRALAADGIEFGSHARTHPDLTTLDAAALEDELSGSRRDLEDRIGMAVRHFAPPYGRSNAAVREAIGRHYLLSAGVRLAEARKSSPSFDLPRIEMHYYRNIGLWRDFLEGRGGVYLQARRAARNFRATASRALGQRA